MLAYVMVTWNIVNLPIFGIIIGMRNLSLGECHENKSIVETSSQCEYAKGMESLDGSRVCFPSDKWSNLESP